MPRYRFCTLYSGSNGNAAYLETPTARILIDAGKSTRALVASLRQIGVEMDSIDAIFVTHDHSDHTSSLEVLTKKHPKPVHIPLKAALRYRDTQPEALCRCLQLYDKIPFSTRVGEVRVHAFETPHDSRASVGYRFELLDQDVKVSVGYATDIGHVSDTLCRELAGCEAVVLESNHDVDLLMEGPYPYELKRRVRGRLGHLSNRECAELAAGLAQQGTTHFLLAHLSEENNRPELALRETSASLQGFAHVLRVAAPHAVTMLVGEEGRPIEKRTLVGEGAL